MTTKAAENDEIQMTNDEAGFGPFVIRPLSLIRHWTLCFVICRRPCVGAIDWLATALELSHVPLCDESRHSQMQRMAAMMSATQLTPIGIW